VIGVDFNALDRTKHNALRLVVVTHTLGTQIRVNFIDLCAHVNSGVRALGLAHVAVDAFFGNK